MRARAHAPEHPSRAPEVGWITKSCAALQSCAGGDSCAAVALQPVRVAWCHGKAYVTPAYGSQINEVTFDSNYNVVSNSKLVSTPAPSSCAGIEKCAWSVLGIGCSPFEADGASWQLFFTVSKIYNQGGLEPTGPVAYDGFVRCRRRRRRTSFRPARRLSALACNSFELSMSCICEGMRSTRRQSFPQRTAHRLARALRRSTRSSRARATRRARSSKSSRACR